MTAFFRRLPWRITLTFAALRQGWPFTRRGRAWYAGATGMEGHMARTHIEIDRKMAAALRYAITGRATPAYTLHGDGEATADGKWAQ